MRSLIGIVTLTTALYACGSDAPGVPKPEEDAGVEECVMECPTGPEGMPGPQGPQGEPGYCEDACTTDDLDDLRNARLQPYLGDTAAKFSGRVQFGGYEGLTAAHLACQDEFGSDARLCNLSDLVISLANPMDAIVADAVTNQDCGWLAYNPDVSTSRTYSVGCNSFTSAELGNGTFATFVDKSEGPSLKDELKDCATEYALLCCR